MKIGTKVMKKMKMSMKTQDTRAKMKMSMKMKKGKMTEGEEEPVEEGHQVE
jgi:hypothetical protein